MAQGVSVTTPILYVVILAIIFFTFTRIYTKKKLNDFTSQKPWYDNNIAKELYYSLKESQVDQKVPDKLLKAAMLKWSAENVHRLLKMREGKVILTTLHQRGSVGDDVWTRFTTSEKLLMLDLQEMTQEAETLKTGWSQQVVALGSEITQNQALRRRIAEVHADTEYREALEKLKNKSAADLEK